MTEKQKTVVGTIMAAHLIFLHFGAYLSQRLFWNGLLAMEF